MSSLSELLNINNNKTVEETETVEETTEETPAPILTECYACPFVPPLAFTIKGKVLKPTKQGLYFPETDVQKAFLDSQIARHTGNVVKKLVEVITEKE